MTKYSSNAIGLFGGTFNPVHNGHLSIGRSFLKSETINTLYVLLNPAPPHKPKESMASYDIRLKMLQAAFLGTPDTKVSDLEKTLPKPCYTIQTLTYLRQKMPKTSFYLCIGKDSFVNFTSWHEWRKILNYCSLLVADRKITPPHNLPDILLKKTTFVDHQPIEISSTQIRNRLAKDEPVNELLPPSVLDIIHQHHLYNAS